MESSSVGDDSKEWDLYLNQDMSFTTNSSEVRISLLNQELDIEE